MKKILFIMLFVSFSFSLSGQVYEVVERTATFGLLPILSDTNERTDGYFLPSILAANKKGYAYIDYNFTAGGLIVPVFDRKAAFAVWYENGANRTTMYGVREIMDFLQPGGPAMPDINHLLGFSLAGNISDNFSIGLTFRYLLGRYYEKDSVEDVVNSHKINVDRIEATPSLTYRTDRFYFDFGLSINYQWITEKALGDYQYDRLTTYDGNVDLSFFGRTGIKTSEIQDIIFSGGFGVIPISEKELTPDDTSARDIKFNRFFWNFKAGTLIKPYEWMRIHPAVILLGSHRVVGTEDLLDPVGEKATARDNTFSFLLTLGMDILPVKWFSIKSGVLKRFDVVGFDFTTKESGVKDKDYFIGEDLGAYLGCSFLWKGFTFTSMLNLDFFTNGPYMLSGNRTAANFAYIATVEYQW